MHTILISFVGSFTLDIVKRCGGAMAKILWGGRAIFKSQEGP